MAPYSSNTLNKKVLFLYMLILHANSTHYANACYSSIYNFGDSLSDTGNLLQFWLSDHNEIPHFGFPPYGETYFDAPTGRCSNGRLIIDFIAEHVGKPLLRPYVSVPSFAEGVNFAVGGATALNTAFYGERGINDTLTKYSLQTQLRWFKHMLQSSSHTSSDRKKILKDSLIVMGEIGGNDYNHALLYGWKSREEIQSFVPSVINAISSAINELIELGAVRIMVPGTLPIGCLAALLTTFINSNIIDYDHSTGCLVWLNNIVEYHNRLLQIELNRIRWLHPHVTIIYADYYNAAMQIYRDPKKFGFTGASLISCCGEGGPYHYNTYSLCGEKPMPVCQDPSTYVNWDGLHLTEAAYRLISIGLLEGPYTTPPFRLSCFSKPTASA
ncbi:hypothetical protein LguiB_034009 [Lonicera macranthoides]